MRHFFLLAGLVLAGVAPRGLAAQDAPRPPSPPPRCCQLPSPPLRIFLDCHSSGCDGAFFRVEFPYLDFMRNPQDADVHVLITEEKTGGGGRAYTVALLGSRTFAGWADTLKAFTQADATGDEERRAIAQQLGLGLARYLAHGPGAGRFALRYSAPTAEQMSATQAAGDRWDSWAFSVGLNAHLNGEQSIRRSNLYASFDANRITPALKILSHEWRSKNHTEFDYTSVDTVTNDTLHLTEISEQESYGAGVRIVPSLGRHWGWAVSTELNHSSFENRVLAFELLTGLEYDIWPFEESTRRLLTVTAYGGIKHYKYDEVTIYGLTTETRPVSGVEVSLHLTQPWGSVSAGLEGSTYLHDLSKNRLELSGGMGIRLVRGLSLSVSGRVASIHDQLSLSAIDPTTGEIFTQQRQLATDYSYSTSIGFGYNFGSAFNNVVNPRFD